MASWMRAVDVFRLANANVQTLMPVVFGNFHVGDVVTEISVEIANDVPVDGFSENLNAAAGAADAGIIISGGFTALSAGASGATGITISIDPSTTGDKSGNAAINFVSDSTARNSLETTDLDSLNVAVQGAVFNFAEPMLNLTEINLGPRHVGYPDLIPVEIIQIELTNVAPIAFSEGLDADFVLPVPGFEIGGDVSVTNLAPHSTASADVHLDVSAASNFDGSILDVNLTSNGTNSGLRSEALAGAQVVLNGQVFQTASSDLPTTNVLNFGIARLNDAVRDESLFVTNTAAVVTLDPTLNDVLRGTFSATTDPISALAGQLDRLAGRLGAQLEETLSFTLDTSGAGMFDETTIFNQSSHNESMADLGLIDAQFQPLAQVNARANPLIDLSSGDGDLSGSGIAYLLDLGTLFEGSTDVQT